MPPDLSNLRSKTPSLPPLSNNIAIVASSETKVRAKIRSPVDTPSPSSEVSAELNVHGEKSVTDVHTQRIIAVLNEAITKVNILMSLPSTIDFRAQHLFGLDLCQEIEKLNTLSRIIDSEDLVDDDGTLNSFQDAVRQVCRILLNDPEKYAQIRNKVANKDETQIESVELYAFQQSLESCRSLTIEKFVKSSQDEETKNLELQCILEREKKTWDEVESLKSQVKDTELNSLNEINAKNEIIRKLKDELRGIKQTAEEVSRKLEVRSNPKNNQVNESECNLPGEIKQLETQLAQDIAKHREEEVVLRKRRFKVESEVEAWISKYDQEMIERQAELDELLAVYRLEKSQHDELLAKFHTLQMEYTKIEEEQKWKDVVKAKLDAERLYRIKCSTKIQATWRGHRTRKQLKEAANKKKPKSAKGSKKKKK